MPGVKNKYLGISRASVKTKRLELWGRRQEGSFRGETPKMDIRKGYSPDPSVWLQQSITAVFIEREQLRGTEMRSTPQRMSENDNRHSGGKGCEVLAELQACIHLTPHATERSKWINSTTNALGSQRLLLL